jgi:CRP-like cAMP-binding protein
MALDCLAAACLILQVFYSNLSAVLDNRRRGGPYMSATPLAAKSETEDAAGALSRAEPFSDLPAAALKAIADIAERRNYLAGEAIFALGQYDGSEFYFVAEGRLKAAAPDRANGAMLVDNVHAGQFFGLAEAVAGGDLQRAELASLTVEEDAEVFAIDAAAFRGLAAQRPSLTRCLMQHFARQLAAGAGHAAPTEPSPESRIFAALMRRIERDAVTGDWRIPRMPKHREIADQSGVEEHVAAAAIALLIQEGVARREYPGLVIVDMQRFARLAD